jgi:putative flippase GtrA
LAVKGSIYKTGENIHYDTILAIVASLITAFIDRSQIAFRETSIWARNKLLVSLMATVAVRAGTQHLGRSHMTWTEIGLDLLIVIACYLAVMALSFVWNLIFAPARLKRQLKQEFKRKAGQASLDQVLTEEAGEINKAVDELLDANEDE